MPRTSRRLTLAAGAREAMSGIRRFRVRNTVRAISPNCSSSSACKRSSGPTTGSPVRLGRLKGREPCAIKKTATTAPAQSAMASCTERWRKRSVAQLRGPVGVVLGSVATFLSIMVPPCVWRLTVDIPSTLLKIVLCTHGACQAVVFTRVYELVVGKKGKKEYPHLDKKSYQPERRLTNGNE